MGIRKNHNPDKPIRKRLSQEEADIINGIRGLCEEQNISVSDVKHGWSKTENASLFFKNPGYKTEDVRHFEKLARDLVNQLSEFSPVFEKIKREKTKRGHLLVVDPADIHIGKLASAVETGEEYNSQIAVQRVLDGVDGILQKTEGWNIDQIVFVAGNDILHVDNARRTTTSGTPQDTDGMWHENFQVAKQLYLDVLAKLLPVADVHFMFNPSNHDYVTGYLLAQVIYEHFRHHPNMTFDVTVSHRKAYHYGDNLIGTTHGDGAKTADLPLLLATEFPNYWAKSKHRYVFIHHFHHKTSKDFIGVTVESLRSPSGADSWHHRNGYQHAPKCVEGFVFCKTHGQIARITHVF